MRRQILALVASIGLSHPAAARVAIDCVDATPSFEVLTAVDDESIRPGLVVIRFRGPIIRPMADSLAAILAGLHKDQHNLILHLSSPGGSLAEAEAAIAAIKASAERGLAISTFVDHGEVCASACIALFMQGRERIAHGASSWLFHGACPLLSNVPEIAATERYIAILAEAGAARPFLDKLAESYLRYPGEYWLSGYELFRADANIITRLLPAWQPKEPAMPPFDPQIRPR